MVFPSFGVYACACWPRVFPCIQAERVAPCCNRSDTPCTMISKSPVFCGYQSHSSTSHSDTVGTISTRESLASAYATPPLSIRRAVASQKPRPYNDCRRTPQRSLLDNVLERFYDTACTAFLWFFHGVCETLRTYPSSTIIPYKSVRKPLNVKFFHINRLKDIQKSLTLELTSD
jgi:hypothetical protein